MKGLSGGIGLERSSQLELSIVIPCLNEGETIEACVAQALRALAASGVQGEVIVADNGSTDGSDDIALRSGARVARVERRGYGAAIQGGIRASHGTYIL